jgi:hypothetical protein
MLSENALLALHREASFEARRKMEEALGWPRISHRLPPERLALSLAFPIMSPYTGAWKVSLPLGRNKQILHVLWNAKHLCSSISYVRQVKLVQPDVVVTLSSERI